MMTTPYSETTVTSASDVDTTAHSAASWSAIFGGAAAAASLSLILLVLGAGLGFSSVSPWMERGVDATTFGVATVLWVTFTQIAASGAGGYIAGRMRSRWVGTHSDEVYFRDTVHGFLAWSVATLATAAVLTSAIGSIVGAGASAGTAVAGTAATGAVAAGAAAASSGASSPTAYFTDSLFRKASDAATPSSDSTGSTSSQPPVAEVGRILAQGIQSGAMSQEDRQYIGQLVAQRTGLSQVDAEKRVSDTFEKAKAALDDAAAKAKDAADKARKASAYAALWLFISLLIGAFVASLAATFGGRRRDLF